MQKYIDNFKFDNINVVERMKSNQVILFMNLELPLSKKWYDSISSFIENNIKNDYLINEDHMRLSDFENDNIEKEKKYYEIKRQDLTNLTKMEILRTEGFNDLLKPKDIKYTKLSLNFLLR